VWLSVILLTVTFTLITIVSTLLHTHVRPTSTSTISSRSGLHKAIMLDVSGDGRYSRCVQFHSLFFALRLVLLPRHPVNDYRLRHERTIPSDKTNSNNHAAILELYLAATTEFCNNQMKFLDLT